MIDIEWANKYTEYLVGSQVLIDEIDNTLLNIK